MPQIGLGTYAISENMIKSVIKTAWENGYRKLDTAQYYNNEKLLAKALKDCGIKREEVFITTKVSEPFLYRFPKLRPYRFNRRDIYSVIRQSFKNLGTDYIDLFLVHYPYRRYEKVWEALTDLYHRGEIRAIGVCSFLPPVLDSLKDYTDVVPAVNQFEISPLNTQKKLINYCRQNGIVAEAMSTFSHFRSSEIRPEIVESETLYPIACAHNKTIPQIVLRWLIQQGISIIPKSTSKDHLQQNIQLNDFCLSDEEMKTIDDMNRGEFLNYNPYPGLLNIPGSYQGWKKFLTY